MAKSKSYEEFVAKFQPKKTTDDCYTPPRVYNAVLEWLRKTTGEKLPFTQIVRPFYPGGDYEHYNYPEGCVVVDNPPFSIFSEILRFYDAHHIRYFLFAPCNMMMTSYSPSRQYVIPAASLTYANGAKVNTGFVTNMLGDDRHIIVDRALREALLDANASKKNTKSFEYPSNLACFTTLSRLARKGVDLQIPRSSVAGPCNVLQLPDGSKSKVYGGGVKINFDLRI